VVDTRQSRLYRAGKPIDIMPKVFDVLVHLLEQKGELVAREVLLQRHWPKLHISEESLTTHIGRIRRAIGHSKQCPLIKTVHGKGYCFVAELVSEQSDDESVPLMTEPVPEPVAASESPARTTAELPAASADTLSTVSDPASFDSPELSARTIPVAAERRQLTVLCCQRISVYDDADDVEAQYQYEQQLRQRCMECFTPLGGHLA
jgi:DNA-binding winged helix-turn-helix (wHTH) protein